MNILGAAILNNTSMQLLLKRSSSEDLGQFLVNQASHYVKIGRIWSFSGPYSSAFGLNMEIQGVNLRIQS